MTQNDADRVIVWQQEEFDQHVSQHEQYGWCYTCHDDGDVDGGDDDR